MLWRRLALVCAPASAAFTWTVTENLNSYYWNTDQYGYTLFTVVGPNGQNSLTYPGYGSGLTPGTSCGSMVSTSGYQNVIRTVYSNSSTSGTIYEYIGANFAQSGDTAVSGTFFQTAITGWSTVLYLNIPGSGLIQYASAGGVPDGATVMTVAQPVSVSGYTTTYEVGVFVNGSMVIDVNVPVTGSIGYAGGLGQCYGGGSSAILTQIDMGSAVTWVSPNPSPTTIPAGSIGVSSFTNHIDLQWPASTDPNGLGMYTYRIYRSDKTAALASTTSLSYSDTTVIPGMQYTYTITAVNQFLLTASTSKVARSVAISSNPPYPSATPEGRRVGVRSTGAYWGASGENIDVRSGNLNFSFPVLSAKGRTGWSVPFNLVYNSQNWRKDLGGNWEYEGDVGYGFGWRFMAGGITPVWNAGGLTANYFLFADASGAEYRLDQNTGNIWSSKDSIYVWFDANTNILHFRDGTYWYFGCVSGPGEPDAGSFYPTLMSDTMGNSIAVTYVAGAGANWNQYWINTSSRIGSITDVRVASGSY